MSFSSQCQRQKGQGVQLIEESIGLTQSPAASKQGYSQSGSNQHDNSEYSTNSNLQKFHFEQKVLNSDFLDQANGQQMVEKSSINIKINDDQENSSVQYESSQIDLQMFQARSISELSETQVQQFFLEFCENKINIIQQKQAVKFTKIALQDQSPDNRLQCAKLLTNCIKKTNFSIKKIIQLTKILTTDETEKVRLESINVLLEYAKKKDVEISEILQLIKPLLKDSYPIQQKCCQVLINFVIRPECTEQMLIFAGKTLLRENLDFVKQFANQVVYAYVEAYPIVQNGRKQEFQIYYILLKDEDSEIRQKAGQVWIDLLQKKKVNHNQLLFLVGPLLQDSRPEIKKQGISVLTHFVKGLTKGSNQMMRIFQDLLYDYSKEVKLVAAATFSQFVNKQGINLNNAIQLLIPFLQDDSQQLEIEVKVEYAKIFVKLLKNNENMMAQFKQLYQRLYQDKTMSIRMQCIKAFPQYIRVEQIDLKKIHQLNEYLLNYRDQQYQKVIERNIVEYIKKEHVDPRQVKKQVENFLQIQSLHVRNIGSQLLSQYAKKPYISFEQIKQLTRELIKSKNPHKRKLSITLLTEIILAGFNKDDTISLISDKESEPNQSLQDFKFEQPEQPILDKISSKKEKSFFDQQKHKKMRIQEIQPQTGLGGVFQLEIVSNILTQSKQINEFNNILVHPEQIKKECRLIYRASDSNFSIEQFQKKCFNIPNTVTLVRTQSDQIFGGYTSSIWDAAKNGQHKAGDSPESFVFAMAKQQNMGHRYLSLFKFELKEDHKAITYENNYGPIFGTDLKIADKANRNKNSSVKFGSSYQPGPLEQRNRYPWQFESFEEEYHFAIKEWEVFQIKYS